MGGAAPARSRRQQAQFRPSPLLSCLTPPCGFWVRERRKEIFADEFRGIGNTGSFQKLTSKDVNFPAAALWRQNGMSGPTVSSGAREGKV